ncbi:MAG TPA: hypothetical protein VHE35_07495 [Kofleriaceae bacterium]|nr:hypothetical protein [Kofleriaceae bacterium]
MDHDEILIDDPRNARVRVVRQPATLRPGTYPMVPPRVMPPYQAAYYQPAPVMAYPPAAYAPAAYPAASVATRFADLSTGEVLALAAQAFAALQPLPAAPVVLGKVDDDLSNLITYQAALAVHAKRDEQLRTVGALIAKFLA